MTHTRNVGICITKTVKDELMEILNRRSPHIKEEVLDVLNCADVHLVHEVTGSELYIWDEIPWDTSTHISVSKYDGPLDVDSATAWLDSFIHLQADPKQNLYTILGIKDNHDTHCYGQYYDNPFKFGLLREITYKSN